MEVTAHSTFEVSSENKADYIGLGTFLVFNNVLKKQRHLVFCTLAWLSSVLALYIALLQHQVRLGVLFLLSL